MTGVMIRLHPISVSFTAGHGELSERPAINMRCRLPRSQSFCRQDGHETANYKWFLSIYEGVETNDSIKAAGCIGHIRVHPPADGEDDRDGEVVGWVGMDSENFRQTLDLFKAGKPPYLFSMHANDLEYGHFPDGSSKVWPQSQSSLIRSLDYTVRLVDEDEPQVAETTLASPQPEARHDSSVRKPEDRAGALLWFIAVVTAATAVKIIF